MPALREERHGLAYGAIQALAPSTTAAPATLFYTYRESGAIAREMDVNPQGAMGSQTLTYAANEAQANFGWVSAPGVPGSTSWPAQTLVVKLTVSVPNAALTITEVKVFRVDSSGGPTTAGLAIVADLPGLSTSLGTRGTLVFTLNGGAQSAGVTDRLGVKFYVRNSSAVEQSFAYQAGAATSSVLLIGTSSTPAPTATPSPSSDPYTSAVLADGAVQNYEFEELSGSLAHDSSANHIAGTYVGRVQYGLGGPILTFPSKAIGLSGGTASAGVLLPNPAAANASYTLESWVYPVPGSQYMTVWGYSATHRLLVNSAGMLLSQLSGNFFSHAALAGSRWHYLAFEYNAAAQRASYFIDGALDASAPVPIASASFAAAYYAGQYDTSTSYKWNGRLGQFAFYKSALSGPQINNHYRAAGYATPAPPNDTPCNGYRWPVKVAVDAGAASINLNAVVQTTLAAMIQTPVLGAGINTPRIVPQETTVYQLTNVTIKQIFRAVDNDYHVVVADAQGRTMITESPEPSCAPSSRLQAQIVAVRNAIDKAIPNVSTTPHTPNLTVTLRGVGFSDYEPNGAFGQARDGIELHPIIAICFGANCVP